MEDVIVISDTIQEYKGEKFYLCGNYFQHGKRRLHRIVYEDNFGKIPKGYHIHHIDENRHNNSISNLKLITQEEHLLNHARSESRRENGKRAIQFAIEKAPEWHKSEEGSKWHSDHVKQMWNNKKPMVFNCTMCGKEFESMTMRMSGRHFCHPNCKAKHLRLRRKGLA